MGNKSNEDAYKRCQSLRKPKDKSCQKALVTLYENVSIDNMHGKSSGLENIFFLTRSLQRDGSIT